MPGSHLLNSSWQLRPWVPPVQLLVKTGAPNCVPGHAQEQGDPFFPFSLEQHCGNAIPRVRSLGAALCRQQGCCWLDVTTRPLLEVGENLALVPRMEPVTLTGHNSYGPGSTVVKGIGQGEEDGVVRALGHL